MPWSKSKTEHKRNLLKNHNRMWNKNLHFNLRKDEIILELHVNCNRKEKYVYSKILYSTYMFADVNFLLCAYFRTLQWLCDFQPAILVLSFQIFCFLCAIHWCKKFLLKIISIEVLGSFWLKISVGKKIFSNYKYYIRTIANVKCFFKWLHSRKVGFRSLKDTSKIVHFFI